MCPINDRLRSKRVRVSTATCIDESADAVRQMVLTFRPVRGVAGALDDIRKATQEHDDRGEGVSFWKLRKLWNTNLQKYGFSLEADEHRSLKAAWFAHLDKQEAEIRARLDHIRRMREQRTGRWESQHEINV